MRHWLFWAELSAAITMPTSRAWSQVSLRARWAERPSKMVMMKKKVILITRMLSLALEAGQGLTDTTTTNPFLQRWDALNALYHMQPKGQHESNCNGPV